MHFGVRTHSTIFTLLTARAYNLKNHSLMRSRKPANDPPPEELRLFYIRNGAASCDDFHKTSVYDVMCEYKYTSARLVLIIHTSTYFRGNNDFDERKMRVLLKSQNRKKERDRIRMDSVEKACLAFMKPFYVG